MSDFDRVLDYADYMGCKPGKQLRWGRASDGSWWVQLVLPDTRLTSTGDTLEFAAWHLMWQNQPPEEDQA